MFVFLTRSVVDQHQHSDKFAESHGCGWSSGSAGCRGAAAHLYAAREEILISTISLPLANPIWKRTFTQVHF